MPLRSGLICLLLFCHPLEGLSEFLSGQPLRVLSGDRLLLLGDSGSRYLIRLQGVSTAPPDQYWGAAAKRYLSTLTMGRFLTVRYEEVDPDGYLRAKLLHGGADVNLRLVQSGLARHKPAGQTPVDRKSYAEAEQQARRSQQGLWSQTNNHGEKRGRTTPGGPLFRLEK
jgi:endonuclease YncB( thermonuclease family)